MSSDSDPVDLAFPDTGTSTSAVDPVDLAFSDTPSQGKTPWDELKYAGGSIVGAGEAALTGITSGAGSLADVVTGSNPGAHDWAYRPRTQAGNEITRGLQNDIINPILNPLNRAAAQNVGAIVGAYGGNQQAAEDEAASRLPEAEGAIGTVTGALKPFSGGARSIASGADALAGPSAGAAGTAVDINDLTPELQQVIKSAGPNLNKDAAMRHIEADTLPIPMRLTQGMATQDPVLISQEKNARGKYPELAQRYNDLNQQLVDNLDEIRRNTAPDAVGNDHIQNGQALIDKYKDYDAQQKAPINQAYTAAKAANSGKDLVLNSNPAAAEASAKLEGREALLPAEGNAVLSRMAGDKPYTLTQMETDRTILSRAARKYQSANDGNAVAALNDVRNSLENMDLSGGSAQVKGLYDKARGLAKDRFDAIRSDPAYEAAVNDDTEPGRASPLADNFVKKYIINGKKSDIQLMKDKFSNDPEASGTISAAALNYLKSKSGVDPYTNTGTFSQAGYNRARIELEPRMSVLLDPQTADQVRQLGNVARNVQAQPAGSYVNNGNTFTSMAAEHAKSGVEHMANYAAHGLPVGTWARKVAQKRSAQQQINDALAPGAGISQ